MLVAVTGGSGKIGRSVLRELLEHDHEVINLDRSPPPIKNASGEPGSEPAGGPGGGPGPYRQVDLCNFEDLTGVLKDFPIDAVVHLANWASVGLVSDARTYSDNVSATFNLFQASADLGIQRVLYASSNHVYGLAGAPPAFLPLTEDHPLCAVSAYGLSKVAGEQAADCFVRNRNMTILSFRLLGIRTPSEMHGEIAQVRERPEEKSYLLWTRCDVRDAAMAFRLALEKKDLASGPYNITGSSIVLERPTEELLEEFFGAKTEVRASLPGRASPFSIEKANRELGYTPRFDWSESNRFPE